MAKNISKVNVKNEAMKRKDFLEIAEKNINDIENIHISTGNSKLGMIPSFSVLPIVTCKNCGECSKFCYACKGCFNFNTNIMNLAENTALVKSNPERVIKEINAYLNGNTVIYKYFRFNVAGDVFDINYLNIAVDVAIANPWTKFLVFTKNYTLFNEYLENNELPENLIVIFSRWNNTPIENPHGMPVAIVNISGETVLPEESYHCTGDCANCLECWNAKKGTFRHFDLH